MRSISQNVMGLINIVSPAWICKKVLLEIKKFTDLPYCRASYSRVSQRLLLSVCICFLTSTNNLLQIWIFFPETVHCKPFSKIITNGSLDTISYQSFLLGQNQGEVKEVPTVQNVKFGLLLAGLCAHSGLNLTLRVRTFLILCVKHHSCFILVLALVLWQNTQNVEYPWKV